MEPVEEPREWVSQMAVVKKPDDSVRICIDPQPLKEALQRAGSTTGLQRLSNMLPTLNNAKVFRNLDVKHVFSHVQLDKESTLLTTMIIPFGRYRWLRLPFRMKVSSEIFQRKLNEALSGLSGVICIAGNGDWQHKR